MEQLTIDQLISARHVMLQKEQTLYIETMERINMSMKGLLQNDFGLLLVKHIGRDLAGEVARRFFDMGDYYLTVDQLYDRFVHFSYDNDIDLLSSDQGIRKAYYNFEDAPSSRALREISQSCQEAQKQLFTEDRKKDKLDQQGKKAYRAEQVTQRGKLYDELTGREGETKIKNGKVHQGSELHADHIQARESITYNARYIREERMEKLKEFYNSSDNMQMMHASANTSKGDVRVCEVGGKIEYLNAKEMKSRQGKGEQIVDITSKATVEQLADATIAQWEKETPSGNKIQTLKDKGYLDDTGKVKPDVRKELERQLRHSQNAESKEILKHTAYGEVAKDAGSHTSKAFKKILAGQMIYYVLPPMVFETQSIMRKKDMTLDQFWLELKKASKRVISYVTSKLGEVFRNIAGNVVSKFIKSFFDILIELVKATVKRMMRIIKDLVMSLVQCCKVLADPHTSTAQKADAITKILAVTVTGVVMEMLMEYLEKQFGIPDFLMEPLQIIVTVIATNSVMLVLQKMDLFNIQYGLLIANIEKLFEEENEKYVVASTAIYEQHAEFIQEQMVHIKSHITQIQQNISTLDIHREEVTPWLQELSDLFEMEIDFDQEWKTFINII